MAFDLSSIRSGKSTKPPRVVVYGEHGIGKSTFGERHTTIVAELVRAGVYPAPAVDLALEAEAGEPN